MPAAIQRDIRVGKLFHPAENLAGTVRLELQAQTDRRFPDRFTLQPVALTMLGREGFDL